MLTSGSDDGVTTIALDRPDRRNALTPSGLRQLRSAIRSADDPVVYLTGRGEAFCAGADFEAVSSLDDRESARAFARLGQSVATAMEGSDAVVVAGIDGPARGGGVELALAADIRVASPSATFAETGVDIGLFGAWGGTVRLPELVGAGRARDLSLTGRTIDAEEARRIGLVSWVTSSPESVATALADKPPRALQTIAELLRPDRSDDQAQFDREAAAFADLVDAGVELPD